MDGDVEAGVLLESVQGCAEIGDGLVRAVEGGAEDPDHADGVLVAELCGGLRVEMESAALHRDLPGLDLPEIAELLPADLHIDAHDQIGFGGRRVAVGVPGRPAAFERQAGEHAGLAGAGGRTAHRRRGVGGVPQVGEHRHTATFQLGGTRVLVLVDHVLVPALTHQHPGLGLHPGGDEGGEIEPGVSVEHQLVMDQAVRGRGRQRSVGQPVPRRRGRHPDRRIRLSEERVQGAPAPLFGRFLVAIRTFVERHRRTALLSSWRR